MRILRIRSRPLTYLVLSIILLAGVFAINGSDAKSRNAGASQNVVAGFEGNNLAEDVFGAVISGGGRYSFPNRVIGSFGAVGGGEGNIAGDHAAVLGGLNNSAIGLRATIGGGSNNSARFEHSTIGGGTGNIADATGTTVSGGYSNIASRLRATVGGGSGNTASFTHATVSGGTQNTANSLATTIGGGSGNTAGGPYATVSGGISNNAGNFAATVSGGSGNIVNGDSSTVGGGLGNRIFSNYSTVSGGLGNIAGIGSQNGKDSRYAVVAGGLDNLAGGLGGTVGGGTRNSAGGDFSAVPGGFSNSAEGDYAFAAGRRAHIDALHKGAFLYADSSDVDFVSTRADEFAVRATGGIRLITAIDKAGNPVAGVQLDQGSSSWSILSDRNGKANFSQVDGKKILDRLAALPISRWNYKSQSPSIQHIGPTAQDFYSAFKLGENDRSINMVDSVGVVIAGIQSLYQSLQEKQIEIDLLQKKISLMEAESLVQQKRIAQMEVRFANIEKSGEVEECP